MGISIALAATVALGLALPAAGQDVPAKPKREKRICKELPAATGTRMGRPRECRTAAEWTALEERKLDELDAKARTDESGLSGGIPTGG